MAFTSFEFIAFLAITLLLYYILPKRCQWQVLLVLGLVFYSLSGLFNLVFLAAAIIITYFSAKKLGKMKDAENQYIQAHRDEMEKEERKQYKNKCKSARFRRLIPALVLIIGIMVADKVFEAYIINELSLTGGTLKKLLLYNYPLRSNRVGLSLLSVMGISYFVFMAAGYLIDVYREKALPQKNIFKLALFLSFFPQTVQGPISRYGDLEPQLFSEHRFDGDGFSRGALRVVWGYFKKMVIADTLAPVIATLTDGQHRGAYVIITVILYTAQIYGDFTGGIDITVGIAEMLGIKLKENFDHPFRSRSLKEYWNRWHITMGSWFTDYIFYPLSVCKPMQKLSKKGREKLGNAIGKRLPVYIATAVTWFATGVWHGVRANFIVWGMLNCAVILVSQEFDPLYKKFHAAFPKLKDSAVWSGFSMVRTFFIVGTLRLLDIYPSVGNTFSHIGSVFTTFNLPEVVKNIGGLGLDLPQIIAVAAATLVVFTVCHFTNKTNLRGKIVSKPALFAGVICALVCVILVFGAYGMGYDASQFIYGGAKFK